jgi:hypothetical protein
VLFEERQRLIPRPLGLGLLAAAVAVVAVSWVQFHGPLPARIQWSLLLPVATVALTVATELRVTVGPSQVRLRFFPFATRTIARADIARWEARTYRPIREYGGWGLRLSRRGRAYSISGNRGVELTLTDGRRVMIGSRRPEELAAAIGQA